jgi:hypothetical protein
MLLRTPCGAADLQTVRHCDAYFKHSSPQIDDLDTTVVSLPLIIGGRPKSPINVGAQ